MTQPILFINTFVNFEDDPQEYQIMYMYKEFFFIQMSETHISLIPVIGLNDEVVGNLLSNGENQQKITNDPKLVAWLDEVIESQVQNQSASEEAKKIVKGPRQ